MRRVVPLVAIVAASCMLGSPTIWAEELRSASLSLEAVEVRQVVVQIGGRFCEYHREEVEEALRQFDAVRQVEFLNDHGTVLVRYETGRVLPERLAGAVEYALAMGWNCKAWVARGRQGEAGF